MISQVAYTGKQLAILQAAEQLIAQHGFDGASVRDIAQQAGVNVAMISYYFGSKERLLEAIIANRIATSGMMLETLLQNKDLDPIQKLDRLVENYVQRMMEHPHYHKIIIREQMSNSSDAKSAVIRKVKLQNLQIVKGLLAEGVRKKVFNKSVDVPLLMTTLFGTFYQVVSNQSFYRQAWNMTGLSDDAFNTQLRKKLTIHLKHILISALTYEA